MISRFRDMYNGIRILFFFCGRELIMTSGIRRSILVAICAFATGECFAQGGSSSVQSATVTDITPSPAKSGVVPPSLRFGVQLQDVETLQLDAFDSKPYVLEDLAALQGQIITPAMRVGVSRPVL